MPDNTRDELDRDIQKQDQMDKVDLNGLVYDMFMAVRAIANGKDPKPFIERHEVFLHDETEDKEEFYELKTMTAREIARSYRKPKLISIASHLGIDAYPIMTKIEIARMIKEKLSQ